MPLYEYSCSACGHSLEKIQKMTDKPLKKCPECGKMKLKKLVSAGSFRISGPGVYKSTSRMD